MDSPGVVCANTHKQPRPPTLFCSSAAHREPPADIGPGSRSASDDAQWAVEGLDIGTPHDYPGRNVWTVGLRRIGDFLAHDGDTFGRLDHGHAGRAKGTRPVGGVRWYGLPRFSGLHDAVGGPMRLAIAPTFRWTSATRFTFATSDSARRRRTALDEARRPRARASRRRTGSAALHISPSSVNGTERYDGGTDAAIQRSLAERLCYSPRRDSHRYPSGRPGAWNAR